MTLPLPAPVPELCEIALGAGRLILRYYAEAQIDVATKPDRSPVTAADIDADEMIRAALDRLDPTIPCLSEETAPPPHTARRDWTRLWLVDPLDGTKEFLRRTDEFTVNIALVEHGEPVVGVIYAPALGLLYGAMRGHGSWRQQDGRAAEQLVSEQADPTQELVVVESRSHPSPRLEAFLRGYRIKRRVQAGSSLKFGVVAEGGADIYPRLGPTMEWDVAAGDCVYRNSRRTGQHPVGLAYNTPTLKNDGFVIGLVPGTFELPA